MKLLIGLIGQIAAVNITRAIARAKRNGILIAIASVLFLTAYAFGLIALAIRLTRHHPPEIAALFVAAGALLLGLIVLVVMAIWNAVEDRRARRRSIAAKSNLAFGLTALQGQPLLMAALAAGFAASLFGKTKRDDD